MARTHLLPARPPPQPGELLSSWLTRLSRANGQNVRRFTRAILSRSLDDGLSKRRAVQFWQHDVDRNATDEQLECFAEASGVNIETLRALTLSQLEGRLTDVVAAQGNSRWIMPLDAHAQVARRYALQFCPACLREDKAPYFRRVWRLALVTVCSRHRALLADRCPSCGASVVPHRTAFGTPDQVMARTITQCHACKIDLCDATLETLGARVPHHSNSPQSRSVRMTAMASVAHLQDWTLAGLERGWFDLRDLALHRLPKKPSSVRAAGHPLNEISSLEFFDGLYTIARLMLKKPARYAPKRWWGKPNRPQGWAWRRGVTHIVYQTVRIPLSCWSLPGRRQFEELTLDDRFAVMACCGFALRGYPQRLRELFDQNAVTPRRLELRRSHVRTPAWLHNVWDSRESVKEKPTGFNPSLPDRCACALALNEYEFQRYFGVTMDLFTQMRSMCQQAEPMKKKSGRPPTLTLEEQLLFALEFWNGDRVMMRHASRWGVSLMIADYTVNRIREIVGGQ